MVIIFEGMDGVGKSSVAKSVAEKVGYEYNNQRLIDVLNINNDTYLNLVEIINNSKNPYLPLSFYTFRTMFDCSCDKNIIFERSILSLYYFEHDKLPYEDFSRLTKMGTIPDLIIVLYASPEERKKRIYSRNANDSDLLSATALYDGYPLMLDFAKDNDLPFVVIDTEKYSLEQVVLLSLEIIKSYELIKDDNEKKEFLKLANEKYGCNYKKYERSRKYE